MTTKTTKPYGHNIGDITMVTVNGKEYTSIIDPRGVQRFKENTAIRAFVDASSRNFDKWLRTDRSDPEPYTLNNFIVDYYEGKHTLDEVLSIYTSIGYSVDGFVDASADWDVTIRNPLWEEDHYSKLPISVLEELMDLIGHDYNDEASPAFAHITGAIIDRKWGVDRAKNYVTAGDTIDNVVVEYLDKYEIEPHEIVVTETTSDELKTFLAHLS